MKSFKRFMFILAIMLFSFCACSHIESARHGRVEVTRLSSGEYDIYSVGGIVSDRSKILQNWEETANKTCNGKYEITKDQTTGQSPAGAMNVQGRIRCKQ